MKVNIKNIQGEVVKKDDRYEVIDNTKLKNLVLSSTDLYPYKATSGHKHPGQEEIYYFIGGYGVMELDDEKITVNAGDVVLIEDGVFHKVFNTGLEDLVFICVFDGSRNH